MKYFEVVVHLPGLVVTSIVRAESQYMLQKMYKESLDSKDEMLMIESTKGTKFFSISKIILFEIFETVETGPKRG